MKSQYTKLALAVGILLTATGFSLGAQAESGLGHTAPSVIAMELVQSANLNPGTPSSALADASISKHNLTISMVDMKEDGTDKVMRTQNSRYGSGNFVPD